MAKPKTVTGVRLDEDMIRRLDFLAAELSRRAAGLDVNRTDVTRAALGRGIDAMERELGLAASPPPEQPKASATPAQKGGKAPRKAK
jgi:predicted DNA-binding protein